jgi:hypothetical protein
MAKKIGNLQSFIGGIADSKKLGIPYSFAWASGLDFRSNPSQFTVNPRAELQTGSVVVDLPMWADLACTNLYFYGNTGYIYQKNSSDVWTVDHIAPNSQGNGMVYFPEDNYLYYAQDKTIGRRSSPCGSGVYYDGFLESEGGEPTNTYSITFAKASSQYASIADNASLSITGDISLETYIKLTTLPSSGDVYTLISKWNENSNQRSYKFDITTSSNFFGDGRDGALTISTNTTEDPVDANCTGTSGAYTLTITNAHASFASVASGDKVLIHQTRGTSAGMYQVATVSSYSAGTLTIQEALTFTVAHSATTSDANKAQIRLLKQHTTVTVNSGITYTCKAWDGLKGGILGFYANTTFTNSGTVTATQKGFRGGDGVTQENNGRQGEGTTGVGGTIATTANGNGGGGGGGGLGDGATGRIGGGGGGAHVSNGGTGGQIRSGTQGPGGAAVSDNLLTTLDFGGGGATGGTGDNSDSNNPNRPGGTGGGVFSFFAATLTNSGTIATNGGNGVAGNTGSSSGSGGGAAGAILIKTQTATLGTMTATGGTGATATGWAYGANGGVGSDGRITVYYSSSVSGTSSPTATLVNDSTLSNTSGYVLRLLISSTGANSETYSWDITDILQTGQWSRWQVTWLSSTSTALFYQNATLLGQRTGAFIAIFNSTARFAIATAYDSSGTAHDFLNGQMDDTRVWNDVRTPGELSTYNDRVLTGVDPNLVAYYKFEQNVNDSQTYTSTSNLTATNTPTYTTDVPFAGITTRADQDIANDSSGSTYTLGTSLSEAAVDRYTFVPTKEPIKSVQLKVDTIGTGNWTVVIHDGLNREIASMTVTNAQLHTGYYEFIFSSSFRPILTASYHVHVYSTVGDGKIVTSSLNTMAGSGGTTGANFATFFQILVDDVYHPMMQFLNFIAVGNERYVAKLEAGNLYTPHQLTLPAGYRVRCFAQWNEYLAIGVWKGTSITDTDQGKIFLWDGTSDTSGSSSPNYIIDVLEGGVNAMQGAAGILSVIAGYEGKLLHFGGAQTQKVTQIPNLEYGKYCEVAPGAMKMWRSILRFGATLNTDSAAVHQGVYGYGKLNVNYPNALGLDFPLSLGDQMTSSTKIGCLFPQGEDLYIGWQSGNSYGIDRVRVTNQPYTSSTMELLITSLGDMSDLKQPVRMRVDFESLTSGQVITAKIKTDRQASWSTLGSMAVVGAKELTLAIDQLNKETQLAVDVTANSTTPTIYQITLESDVIPSPV